MVTSPYERKILEWDVKQQIINQWIQAGAKLEKDIHASLVNKNKIWLHFNVYINNLQNFVGEKFSNTT
jgi:deoxyhypusine synthase